MSKTNEISLKLEKKARDIIRSIEERIGFHKKTGLVKAAEDDPLVDSFENLALALAYRTQAKIEKFAHLVAGVKHWIGFDDDGFLRNRLDGDIIYSSDQALLSLCLKYFSPEESKRLAEKLLAFVDRDKWLVSNGRDDKRTYTFSFILTAMALAEAGYWEETALIKNSLFQRLHFTAEGLAMGIPGRKLSRSKPETGVFTLDNILLVNLYCAAPQNPEKIREAVKIVETIDQNIGYDSKTDLYYRSSTDHRLYTFVNAIASYTLQCLSNVVSIYYKPIMESKTVSS